MTITAFDRSTVRILRKELEDAVEAVAQRYGLTVEHQNTVRFTSNRFKVGFTICAGRSSKAVDQGVSSKENEVNNFARLMGIKTPVYYKRILLGGRKYMVVDVEPSRPKYPFIIQGSRGGRYKASVEDILKGLSKAND